MVELSAAQRRKAAAAQWAVQQMSRQEWDNLCERFIENAYGTSGQFPTAAAGGSALVSHPHRPTGNPLEGAEVGDLLFFAPDATNQNAGHVGIYVGNGQMVSATPSGVRKTGILNDPYYGQRFLGWGSAPDAWKGQTQTPELMKGAEQLAAAGQGQGEGTMTAQQLQAALDAKYGKNQYNVGYPASGGPLVVTKAPHTPGSVVAIHAPATEDDASLIEAYAQELGVGGTNATVDDPILTNLTKQRATAQSRLTTAQAELQAVRQDPAWAAARPNTDDPRWVAANDRVEAAQKAVQTAQTAVEKVDGDIAARQAALAKTPANAPEPKGTTRKVRATFPDGNQYLVTEVADGLGNWSTDETKAPERYGPGKVEKDTSARDAVDLQTAQTNLARAQLQLQQEQDPLRREQLQLQVQQAQVALQQAQVNLTRAQQPQQLSADTTTPNLAFRDATGTITTQPNPNFDAAKAELARKAQDLDNQYKQGLIDKQERDRQYQEWKDAYIDRPLQLYTAQLTQYDREQTYARDQAAERVRVEQANQERAKYIDQQAVAAQDRWRQMAPAARSDAFTQQYAQNVANMASGKPVTWTPEQLTAPPPIPNLADVASQRVAQLTAAINPIAAQQIGAPPPKLDLSALMNSIPRFTYTPPTPPTPEQPPTPPAAAPGLTLPLT